MNTPKSEKENPKDSICVRLLKVHKPSQAKATPWCDKTVVVGKALKPKALTQNQGVDERLV